MGVSGGAMNYKGDLDDRLSAKFTKPAAAIHFYYLTESEINFSLSFLHGKIECDDAKAGISKNKFRNLRFHSDISQIYATVIYRIQNVVDSFSLRQKFTPYIFAGLGLFHFNPKRNLNGVEYELQKIGTEGQYLQGPSENYYPKPYSLWQISLPFGVGVKARLTRNIDAGLEMCLNKTFTDYLDDVSRRYPDKEKMLAEKGEDILYLSDSSNDPRRPDGRHSYSRRGNPLKKDWFIYTNLSVTYYFTSKMKRIVF
jgi:hypothetical protein